MTIFGSLSSIENIVTLYDTKGNTLEKNVPLVSFRTDFEWSAYQSENVQDLCPLWIII